MSARFEDAILVILKHEGGDRFTQIKGDRGGATKYGITLATLRCWRGKPTTPENVRQLKQTEAEEIYRSRYWEACRCGELIDQDVATKIFDIAVNCGTWAAIRMAQRAAVVPVDGVMGPQTIAAINADNPGLYMIGITSLQKSHYKQIVKKDPSQEKFLLGWMNRAEWRGTQ